MAGLNAFIQRLERFAADEVKQRVTAKVRDAMHAACIEGFNAKRDPYGSPWAPRKPPKAWAVRAFGLIDDRHPLLDDTGAMIGSLSTSAVGGRVLMRILGYAKFHQYGTVKMVARKMFPDPARGLGLWSGPIYDAAVDAIKELMK